MATEHENLKVHHCVDELLSKLTMALAHTLNLALIKCSALVHKIPVQMCVSFIYIRSA